MTLIASIAPLRSFFVRVFARRVGDHRLLYFCSTKRSFITRSWLNISIRIFPFFSFVLFPFRLFCVTRFNFRLCSRPSMCSLFEVPLPPLSLFLPWSCLLDQLSCTLFGSFFFACKVRNFAHKSKFKVQVRDEDTWLWFSLSLSLSRFAARELLYSAPGSLESKVEKMRRNRKKKKRRGRRKKNHPKLEFKAGCIVSASVGFMSSLSLSLSLSLSSQLRVNFYYELYTATKRILTHGSHSRVTLSLPSSCAFCRSNSCLCHHRFCFRFLSSLKDWPVFSFYFRPLTLFPLNLKDLNNSWKKQRAAQEKQVKFSLSKSYTLFSLKQREKKESIDEIAFNFAPEMKVWRGKDFWFMFIIKWQNWHWEIHCASRGQGKNPCGKNQRRQN